MKFVFSRQLKRVFSPVVLMTACVAGSAVVIAAGVVAGTATTGTVKTSAIINYIQLYIVISTGLYSPVS